MLNWAGVSEFVAVTETESFTAASKRLGISTAQVSRQISALEKRLSVVKSIFDTNIKDHRDTQTVVKDYIRCNMPK